MLPETDRDWLFQRLAAFIDAGAEEDAAERLARLALALALQCPDRVAVEAALKLAETADGK